LSLPLDPSWETGYKLCSFTSNLYRYAEEVPPGLVPPAVHGHVEVLVGLLRELRRGGSHAFVRAHPRSAQRRRLPRPKRWGACVHVELSLYP
jgi:hypothetical protein